MFPVSAQLAVTARAFPTPGQGRASRCCGYSICKSPSLWGPRRPSNRAAMDSNLLLCNGDVGWPSGFKWLELHQGGLQSSMSFNVLFQSTTYKMSLRFMPVPEMCSMCWWLGGNAGRRMAKVWLSIVTKEVGKALLISEISEPGKQK